MTGRDRLPRLVAGAAFVFVALALPAAAVAQAAAPPDLSGMWINQYTPDLARALGKQPPFTAEGAERWRTVDTSKDPTGLCLPPGPTRAFTAPFPFLLVQHPTMIGLMFEYFTTWRTIYLDGRPHPADIADYPDFMGHSIGHWEGQALVVDTVGIDGRSWLDTAGHEHSDKLHLTERFEKINDDNIRYTVTYDDPVFFSKPFSIVRIFKRASATDRILPYACEENNLDKDHLVPSKKP